MRENREKQKKLPLPSVFTLALGNACISRFLENVFAECQGKNTRQRLKLCRVHFSWHSAKALATLPSAIAFALGKAIFQQPKKWSLCRVPR